MTEIETLKTEIADLQRRLSRMHAEPAVAETVRRQIARRERRLRQLETLAQLTPLSAG